MAEKFAGHSTLGKRLNNIVSKTDHIDIDRFKTARAIIIESIDEKQYIFKMDLLNSKGDVVGRTGYIPLIGEPTALAASYGTAKNLLLTGSSGWECIIFYRGTSASSGVAMITRKATLLEGGRFTEANEANIVTSSGTAIASPGAGM